LEKILPERVRAATAALEGLGADAMLIAKPENVVYLSDFKSSNCYLLITSGESYIITDFRYIEAAQSNKAGLVPVSTGRDFTLFDAISKTGVKMLAIEEEYVTYGFYKELSVKFNGSLKSADGIIEGLRIIKDDYEKDCIRIAESIGDKAFTHMLEFLKVGMTEKEAALELEFAMRNLGAEGLSFDSIVASGTNSSMPHAIPGNRRFEPGDFLTMDFGCKYLGYCSDMTRTIAFGEPVKEQIDIYNIVKEAQQKSLETVCAGKNASDIDRTARDIIKYYGYSECFGHGLGHGVGLEIHEAPTLNPSGREILKAGMTVTIEPGIYLPGKFGVRIEDLLIVNENGYEVLSSSQKDLLII